MLSKIKINEQSDVPKYIQIADALVQMIDDGLLNLGDRLPSINGAYKTLGISRDTLIGAYMELRARGIVSPRHGKGYYISRTSTNQALNIFVLFDVMNGYKAILYRSLLRHLGKKAKVDIHFHYYNREVFRSLVNSAIGKYNYYVLMPHFNEDVTGIISVIPADKLLLIDHDVITCKKKHAAVYQDFESDIYLAMKSGKTLLRKYKKLIFIVNKEFQFIPDGIIAGFERFCSEFQFEYAYVDYIAEYTISKGEVFIVFTDNDLVTLIKLAQEKAFKMGTDIGVVSYDDTPLKEVLEDGISVISTDFRKMGQTAAELILGRSRAKIANPSQLIVRKSL